MSSLIAQAESRLLAPGGLGTGDLDRVFTQLMGPVDRCGRPVFSAFAQRVVGAGRGHRQGRQPFDRAGRWRPRDERRENRLRLFGRNRLAAAAGSFAAARAIAHGGNGAGKPLALHGARQLYPAIDPVDSLPNPDKIAVLREVDAYARARDPRVKQVIVSLSATLDTVLVAGSDGTLAADVRPLVRLSVQVIVEQNGRREQGYAGGGGRYGYRELLENGRAMAFADEAVRQALVNLDSVDAPAGTMTVVLGPGWPGVLLHEAIGHGLEGDFNRKGSSAFAGRMGQRVAAPGVTVVDDGTLQGRRGSLTVDDEGTPTECTTLIEDGILKGYMQDKLNARLMGMAPTGNGRRESFAQLPMPRMTNTYMLGRTARSAGHHSLGEARSLCRELRRWSGGYHQRQVRVLRQ
jgi:TldD protein